MRSIAAIRHFSEEIYQPHYKQVLAYQVHEGEPTGAQRKLIAHVIVEAGILFILPGILGYQKSTCIQIDTVAVAVACEHLNCGYRDPLCTSVDADGVLWQTVHTYTQVRCLLRCVLVMTNCSNRW